MWKLWKPAEAPIPDRATQTQIFENSTDMDWVVDVEMYPDRYVLRPGDVMEITYAHDGQGYGLHTIIHPDSALQIYLEAFDTAVVTINGECVEPWTQPGAQEGDSI